MRLNGYTKVIKIAIFNKCTYCYSQIRINQRTFICDPILTEKKVYLFICQMLDQNSKPISVIKNFMQKQI